jgi:hypothetical protein
MVDEAFVAAVRVNPLRDPAHMTAEVDEDQVLTGLV